MSEHFDASLALRQVLQEIEPVRVRERLGDGGELRKQRLFRVLACHSSASICSIDYLNDASDFVNLAIDAIAAATFVSDTIVVLQIRLFKS